MRTVGFAGVVSLAVVIPVLASGDTLASESIVDQILLCTNDSLNAEKGKLVYSYIDGEKTECLPEQELRELLSNAQLTNIRDSIEAEKKKSGRYYEDLVRHGHRELSGADLKMADLMDCNLDSADLSNADLSNADLRGVTFRGANLKGAILATAYCRRADFRGAILEGADITGAYLNECDLRGASGISFEMLKKARTLHEARMDSTLAAAIEEQAWMLLREPKAGWVDNRWAPTPEEQKKSKRR